jgi:hypothetical protein
MSPVPAVFAGIDEAQAAYDRGDFARAYKEFKSLAEHGVAEAQNNLGAMLANGLGGPKNLPEAVKWFRGAAEQGNVTAQKNLGYMYANGLGVPGDFSEAAKWYHRAAEQGNVYAQNNLGALYGEGLGVPKNNAEAEKWFRRASDQGLAEAQQNLAVLLQGEGRNLLSESAGKNRRIEEIPLEKRAGVYMVPVRINGSLTLSFILDTGASEVNISADVVARLLLTGAIDKADFLPGLAYRMADGNIVKSSRLKLRLLEVGGVKISEVTASIVPGTGSLLLGQSFLGRLQSWSLDNQRNVLRIGG